jgi:hypothetical protein
MAFDIDVWEEQIESFYAPFTYGGEIATRAI